MEKSNYEAVSEIVDKVAQKFKRERALLREIDEIVERTIHEVEAVKARRLRKLEGNPTTQTKNGLKIFT